MKQTESNALRRELARGRAAEPHPDADVLTAFAENALIERERRAVMEHLSACVNCREILGLATDAAPRPLEVQGRETEPLRSRRWIWVPWVATAATVIVVSSVVVIRHKPVPQARVQVAQNVPAAVPQQAAGKPAAVPEAPLRKPVHKRVPAVAPAPEAKKQPPPEALSALGGVGAPKMFSRAATVENAAPDIQTESVTTDAMVPGEQAHGAPPVQAQGTTMSAFKSAAPAPPLPMARSGAAGKIAGALAIRSRPQWRINDAGQVERSTGSGAWEAVRPDNTIKFRVVCVTGPEVWAGGEGLRLFRSTDNGVTWQAVQLPGKSATAKAITHIEFPTQLTGTVEADDGTTWRTADGGQTWK